ELGQIRDLFLVGGFSFNAPIYDPSLSSYEASRRVELRLEFRALDEPQAPPPAAAPPSAPGKCRWTADARARTPRACARRQRAGIAAEAARRQPPDRRRPRGARSLAARSRPRSAAARAGWRGTRSLPAGATRPLPAPRPPAVLRRRAAGCRRPAPDRG